MTSICAICYNQKKYIPFFIESVLKQTSDDWELIVVDDCSTDGSFECLSEYAKGDSRIRVYQNDRNRHLCHTGNRALSLAKGDLVTIMYCDDAFLPVKVAHDREFMEAHRDVDALYAVPQIIAADNSRRDDWEFRTEDSRGALLRQELFGLNQLPIPGLTLRRSLLDKIGGFDPLLRLTQDHELHLRILEHGRMAWAEIPTTCYRRHDNNLSAHTPAVRNAVSNESVYFLMRHYLSGITSVEDLLSACPECRKYGDPAEEAIPYFLSRFAIEFGQEPCVRFAGLLALQQFMRSDNVRQMLERRYDFLSKDFMKLAEMPMLEALRDLTRAQDALRLIEKSVSYRLGLALTYPLRRIYRMFNPLVEGEV